MSDTTHGHPAGETLVDDLPAPPDDHGAGSAPPRRSRRPKGKPKHARTERLDIVCGRYSEDHQVIGLAKAKIVTLGDEPLEVTIKGRKPDNDDPRNSSVYFIEARVRPQPGNAGDEATS